ncbi:MULTISPECIES: hypothetical protein [Actinoplanes]|uniref:hypothetical protein n=1 Tax=Actinoplanes TaxID=1865 RepID=UPI000A73E414|nr:MULTISPECIES: hypothetical protein [Actinoplanes]GLY06190.1 hypothetical protein Acsp01_65690 [Actinoplanes sp. NBRC 101535]
MSLGLLALVVGAVWTLQGLNYLTDSLLHGEIVMAAAGGGSAVAGLVLIVIGMRRRTAAREASAALP